MHDYPLMLPSLGAVNLTPIVGVDPVWVTVRSPRHVQRGEPGFLAPTVVDMAPYFFALAWWDLLATFEMFDDKGFDVWAELRFFETVRLPDAPTQTDTDDPTYHVNLKFNNSAHAWKWITLHRWNDIIWRAHNHQQVNGYASKLHSLIVPFMTPFITGQRTTALDSLATFTKLWCRDTATPWEILSNSRGTISLMVVGRVAGGPLMPVSRAAAYLRAGFDGDEARLIEFSVTTPRPSLDALTTLAALATPS